LCGGAVAFATIALSGCAALFARKRKADVTATRTNGVVRVPVSSAPWVRGGQGSLLIAVSGEDDKVLVFRDPEGALAAVSTACTHMGCDVGYDSGKGHIVCPCHGSEFSNSGEVMHGPAKSPLRAYPVSVADDEIVIRIE
jgi:Rieske Fe-S protein